MRTFPIAVFSTLLALLNGATAQRPPGYEGSFPSERAQEALRELAGPWEDKKGILGGGTWQLQSGGVTPHALGPCRGDVTEMREATVKGPHLRLRRDHLGVCLPATTDGDVAATLRWLGQEVPDGIKGEPTAAWRRAAARLESLGGETAGLRVGLLADPDQAGSVELVVWKTGTDKAPVTGKAVLKVDGEPVSIELAWPAKEAKERSAPGRIELALEPGNTFVLGFDVDELLKAKGRPKLKEGVRLLQVEMRCRASDGKENVLGTQRLQFQVAGPNNVK